MDEAAIGFWRTPAGIAGISSVRADLAVSDLGARPMATDDIPEGLVRSEELQRLCENLTAPRAMSCEVSYQSPLAV